ncbi:cytochrome P450 [Mesorhizobium sp. RP14(2022)]|uniref:Cytochrome P450 n=1 Tax=Mesorhizobium liriopis TaxID=2953882 RepID=A0ABT1C408_9HYPH|nr:cytochrome P450 [Mesorhizobium liriopis]MCO6049571.1 cytochrome P450 [Mesorhizobium liriopis]
MPGLKYFDAIREAQVKSPPIDQLPPFDIERLRNTGTVPKLIGRFLENPRWWLSLLRQFWPTPRLGRFMLATCHRDVREILERGEDFETPYGLEMTEMGGGAPFILGLQDGSLYRRLKGQVLAAFPPDEITRIVEPMARDYARSIMRQAAPPFDAVSDLLRLVPVRICRDYYGLRIDDEPLFADWTLTLSALFFSDPTAKPATRELALVAADRVGMLIDLSLAQADTLAPGKPVSRLRAMVDDGRLTHEEARAVLMGMVVGFVPTNILGSGNVLDVILSRPDARAAFDDALAAQDDRMLDKVIYEAMRFKPIWIGPWRYVPRDTVLGQGTPRERRVKAGTVVMPATLSAMFDAEAIPDPDRFDPLRSQRQSMVFGHGIHLCIGMEMARVQIRECLKALFAKPGLKRVKGRKGRLTRLGAYPERLLVAFERHELVQTTPQALVTICCEVRRQAPLAALEEQIAALGNPAQGPIGQALAASGIIHFTSITLFKGEAETNEASYVVIELSGDGDRNTVVEGFAEHAEPFLRPLLEVGCGLSPREPLARFLLGRCLDISASFGSLSGLVFSGTPGHSVKRILAEEDLACAVRDSIEGARGEGKGAAETLAQVRQTITADPRFGWAFEPAVSRLDKPQGSRWKVLRATLLAPRVALFVALVYLVCVWLTFWGLFDLRVNPITVGTSFLLALLGPGAVVLIVVAIGLWLLRRLENHDRPDDAAVPLSELEALMAGENWTAQNHLTAVSRIKPGFIRIMSLRAAFYLVSITATHLFKPGFLGSLNTIHAARWVVLPDRKRLVFLSNYDGSWESYLEDFIAKASAGLTGIWSNAKGYPRTRFLFLDGARDGERFKRWARRQQVPTRFWFSAYPNLTTGRIRTNAAIRKGLASATDAQARDWLSLFGSMPPRPVMEPAQTLIMPFTREPPSAETLESGEIQSVFFNALGRLEHAEMLALRVPKDIARAQRREWLAWVLEKTSFGDHVPEMSAMLSAFGPGGLEKLGLEAGPDGAPLQTFPAAFRQTMGNPERSRILADAEEDRPPRWLWGNAANPVDVALVLYARDAATFKAVRAEAEARIDEAGLVIAHRLPLHIHRENGRAVEHFGFADGISQPIVRGTRRAVRKDAAPRHTLAAGEFLFGYRDEHGFCPASPSVPAGRDPAGTLHDAGEDAHDFGRNGSFLVMRQFSQDVSAFENFCEARAQSFNHPDKQPVSARYIAAKMMGRWPEGAALTRCPEDHRTDRIENDFSFGAEDPQGLACPFGAHIRRSNPRDSLGGDAEIQIKINKRHRILRIGRSYGARRGRGEKGLLFMCLNADIERQYEFIQQSWASSAFFHGLSGERDPIIAPSGQGGRFTIPHWEGSEVLENVPRFVATRGGGYFFLPSRAALRFLLSRLGSGEAVLRRRDTPKGWSAEQA